MGNPQSDNLSVNKLATDAIQPGFKHIKLSGAIKGFATLNATLSSRSRKKTLSTKLNQLSLWLGRLVIAFNNLEHTLAREVALELIEVMGVIDRIDYSPKRPLVRLSPTERRVDDLGLNDMILASMSFGQKLDFLAALSLKKFSDNPRQQNHVRLIVKALSEAEGFRNRMLHSIWTENFVDYSQMKARTKGRKGLKIERANANIPNIRLAVKAINTLEHLGLFAMTHDAIVGESDEELFCMSEVFQKS